MDIPKRARIIQALIERGYRASPTHIDSQAIKTDADLSTCIAVARRERNDIDCGSQSRLD
jgi:tRNA (guanine26-N2/guanine27-N2)-dimethyltransferase